jgi:ubiquinone/menaquinone biosynthesis C-methylase UbiE
MSRNPDTLQNDPLLETIRDHWDAAAPGYDLRAGHGLSEGERWAWRRVLGQALPSPAETAATAVLDVGTGTGEMALLMAAMGLQVSGVDLAPAMLEIARGKARLQGTPVSWTQAAADALPFPSHTFDVVFSRHLFWTLPDPHRAVREWARVLRPGGVMLIADGWWHEPSRRAELRRATGRALRRVFTRGDDQRYHYAGVTAKLPVVDGVSPYSIRYYLDSAGLTQIRVRDLRSIRRAERGARPMWQWIDMARYTWLARAIKPDS